MNKKTKSMFKTHFEQLMEKDRWHANELGLDVSAENSHYRFNFGNIKLSWLKNVAKQLTYQQASTKTYGTCYSYLKALISFDRFISEVNFNIKPEEIDRKLIVDYIHNLCAEKKLQAGTVGHYLKSIRYFFEANRREKWLAITNEPLIFNEDFPRIITPLPKFIPEIVIQQLLENLDNLPEPDQHLVILFLETGRRCGEIFTLPYHCLQQDNVGDYYMKVEDRKMKRTLLIPISENCVQHIKQQQTYIDKTSLAKDFLFVIKKNGKRHQIKSNTVIFRLNAIAKKNNIVDDNGCLWHFHFHQFRHTVATRMINHGVSQHIVQRFLGHLSPEMTKRYAAIHDSTLKEEFKKFQKRFYKSQEEILVEKALSDPGALTEYQKELEDIKKCVNMAKTKGWQEALIQNIKRQKILEKMVMIIERGNIGAKNET